MTMSPKCEVASLSSLALYNIVTQVIHALSDDEGEFYDEVSKYHKYTPPEILEDMISEILSNDNLDAGIRFSCLQVFLKNNVKKLVTGIFPHSYYERILHIISANGSGLLHLNLKGVWVKEYPELMCNILQHVEYLKVLYIPHFADNTVLKCVANCKNLKVLDISGECNFTIEGLNEFGKILRENKSSLRIIDIGSFGEENIPCESIAELIESIPQLTTLSSYSFVGKALLHIYRRNKSFTCTLKHIHDTNTTREICEAVLKVCPLLENLYFDTPEQDVIEMIRNFNLLNCLKLNKFPCNEVQKLFSSWGNNLHTLKLSHGRGILDVSIFANTCSNLVSLELYKMEFISHTTDSPFCKLQELEILHSELTPPCLKYILERSPEIRKIEIGNPVKLTDGDLYRLCADFCLLYMEQLYFTNARYLTVNAVELLMGHCPQLRVLGQLGGWNMSPDDVEFMRAVIQSTNADLTLLLEGIYTF